MNSKTDFYQAFAERPSPYDSEILYHPPNYESKDLFKLLKNKKPDELTVHDLSSTVEDHLWMLAPKAFLYFLPRFMQAALTSYSSLSVFSSELIGTLTKPSFKDDMESIDKYLSLKTHLDLPDNFIEELQNQQLEFSNSGISLKIFEERFDKVKKQEGMAILDFLEAFREAFSVDFPFDELDTAINSYWQKFRDNTDFETA